MHLEEEIQIPSWSRTKKVRVLTETLKIKTDADSILKILAVVDMPEIDVTFKVANSSNTYDSNSLFNERTLTLAIEGAVEYTVTFTYSLKGTQNPDCQKFSLQLAISEIRDNSACSTPDSMPPSSVSLISLGPKKYHFTSSSKLPHTYKINVTVPTDRASLRAKMTFDFVSSLSYIAICNNLACDKRIKGQYFYNGNEILPIYLDKGSYELRIVQLEGFVGCIDFTFELYVNDTVQDNVPSCFKESLPSSLNGIGLISPYSLGSVHFRRHIYANSKHKEDLLTFQIQELSLLRLFVPKHAQIDVDIYLHAGKEIQSIDYRNTNDEETIWEQLQAGTYSIQFYYYGAQSVSLPLPNDCVAIPFEISIRPVSQLQSINRLTGICNQEQEPFPQTLGEFYNTRFEGFDISRQIHQSMPFVHQVSFTVSNSSYLAVELGFDFLSGALSFKLDGKIFSAQSSSSTTKVSYSADISEDRAYMYRLLPSGNYTLTFSDPTQDPHQPNQNPPYDWLHCSSFFIGMGVYGSLAGNKSDSTDSNPCPIYQMLPTDLFSQIGGSDEFGGPQDEQTGEIRMYGVNFPIPLQASPFNIVQQSFFFEIKQPSMLRAAYYSESGSDIDFAIFKGVYRNDSSSRWTFSQNGDFENAYARLDRPDTYEFVFRYFRPVQNNKCAPVFDFEFAIETVSTVQQKLACPTPLPSNHLPARQLRIDSGKIKQVSSDFFTLTQQDYAKFIDSEGFFDYPISLNFTADDNTLVVQVAFDFVISDFTLAFTSEDDLTFRPVIGEYAADPDRATQYNYMNTLYIAGLPKGSYLLEIIEDQSRVDFNSTGYCIPFDFYLLAMNFGPSQNGTEDGAKLISVRPNGGSNFDSRQYLEIALVFDRPIESPAAADLDHEISQSNHLLYLKDLQDPNTFVLPNLAFYDEQQKELSLFYFPGSLKVAHTYSLFVDVERFSADDGVSATSLISFSQNPPLFDFSLCLCSNHGSCVGTSQVCKCDAGYTGADCSACDEGYHASSGQACVEDEVCQVNSCNGHGTCDDSQGFIQCTCAQGYASQGASYFCAVCAEGYIGYPNCVRRDASADRTPECKAALLPTDLNTVEYLAFQDDIYLDDSYFLDIDDDSQKVVFKPRVDSLLKFSIDRTTNMDLSFDVMLFEDQASGSTLVSQTSSDGYEEPTIFFNIKANVKYTLEIRYEFSRFADLHVSKLSCLSSHMTFRIISKPLLDELAGVLEPQCGSNSILPDLPTNTRVTIPAEGLKFTGSNRVFSRRKSSIPAPPDLARFFYSFSFTVSQVPLHFAQLKSKVTYEYAAGSLVLLLERGDLKSACDGYSTISFEDACLRGTSRYQENYLNTPLPAGNYTLWIGSYDGLMPKPVNCTAFGFSLEIEYQKEVLHPEFYCEGVPLPESLNQPGYLDDQGYMHLADTYSLPIDVDDQWTEFHTQNESLVRIYLPGKQKWGGAKLVVINLATSDLIASFTSISDEKTFVSTLPAGYYGIRISYVETDPIQAALCYSMPIEWSIMPIGFVNEALSSSQALASCPANLLNKLPSIPTRIPLPFALNYPLAKNRGVNPYYYFYDPSKMTGTIQTFPLSINKKTKIFAQVASNFLLADIGLYIKDKATNSTIISSHSWENFNTIADTLFPGSFDFVIAYYPLAYVSNLPLCFSFDFALSLAEETSVPVSASTNSTFESCSNKIKGLRQLPKDLNTPGYLGFQGFTHIHSGLFLVPTDLDFHTKETISFKVARTSLIRVYTEPSEIDIDIVLYDNGDSRLFTDRVARSANLAGEETFVYLLQPGANYQLDFVFYRWEEETKDIACITFNAEIEIEPIDDAFQQEPVLCPTAGDHFPTLNPVDFNGTETAIYDSVAAKETLYIQQVVGNPKKTYWRLTFVDTVMIYAQVEYNFVLSDLALSLTRVYDNGDSDELIFGTNGANKNTLLALQVKRGTYDLLLYEPISYSNQNDFTHCAHFYFKLIVSPRSDYDFGTAELDFGITMNKEVPTTLSTPGYLQFDNQVHLREEYLVPQLIAGNHSPLKREVDFTINEPSYLRLFVKSHKNIDIDIHVYQMMLGVPTLVASAMNPLGQDEFLFSQLSVGNFYLKFLFLPGQNGYYPAVGDIETFNTEVAIAPVTVVRNHIQFINTEIGTCTDSRPPASLLSQSDGSINYSDLYGQLHSSFAGSNTTLASTRINLTSKSAFYARLGFDFLSGDMLLRLKSTNSTKIWQKNRKQQA